MEANIVYTIIIPFFNENEVIFETYTRLKRVMEDFKETYELIFVDDGSTDTSNKIILDLSCKDSNIKLLTFSRNFGHEAAISAGIDFASGKAVVIMDADLQDPPEVIQKLVAKWREDYDIVYGRRIKRRHETFFKRTTSAIFYRLLNYLTDYEIPVDVGDFRLIGRKVCDCLKGLREKNRYMRGLISWTGFKQTQVEYIREERWGGDSKYSFKKRLKLSLDAITSFSYRPLKFAIVIGFFLSVLSFLYLMVVIYQKLFTHTTVIGWASIVALSLFFNGMILIILGIIGEYIARIYEETKNRPLYIIRNKVGF